MAQTNYTPIQLYYSSTASAVPVNTNLASGELAINITDGILFYKDNAGTVQKIGYKLTPTTAGGTGLTSFTANGIVYASSTSALNTSSALVFDGTNLGVGVSPASDGAIHVHRVGASFPTIKITNGTTGTGNLDGFDLICGSGGEAYVYNRENQPILFGVNNSEKMRIEAATGGVGAVGIGYTSLTSVGDNGLAVLGNVGIGTSSPAYKLQIANNGNFNTTVNVSNTTAGTSSYARFLSISDGGNASFGMTSTTYTDVTSAADSLLINASGASGGIVFAHDGVSKMLLDSSGNLGIGTSSSLTEKLNVVNSGSYAAVRVSNGTNSSLFGYANADGNYNTGAKAGDAIIRGAVGVSIEGNNGTSGMRLDSSGNLGLGITPSANAGVSTLSIANYNKTFSALTFGSNANSAGYVGYNMGNTSTSNTWKYISADTGSALYFAGNEMRFMQFASGSAGATTSGTQAMTLDASGRLMVGVTSNINSSTVIQAGGTNNARIGIDSPDSQGFYFTKSSANNGTYRVDTNGNFEWYTKNVSQAMVLDVSGNLGLGVTPSGWFTSNNLKAVQLGGGSLVSYLNNQVWLASNYYLNSSGQDTYVGTGASNRLIMDGAYKFNIAPSGTAGNAITFTTAMTLDSSGNLGLGVTPSGWGSGRPAFQVKAVSVFEYSDGARWSYNLYQDGTNFKPIATGGYASYGQAGDHRWYIGSGTINVSTTPTQAMTLDASGNLLVGATSNSSTSGTGFKVTSPVAGHWDPVVVTSGNNASYSCWDIYSTGAGAYRFYVTTTGVINATSTTITAISDERLKENIRDLDYGLASVMSLKPRKFDWKEGKGQDKKNVAGFIAQEFENVFPECVGKSKAGDDGIEYKNINHEALIPTLVKAIQELKAEIDSLKSQLNGA